ncbi:Protein kinase-like domain [Pseudocohnilembus persalinus]|uniref:Protein kinase-like domain n=1 Tax=Pseudocohnilembus persalinus TaxID=266149 RepID=A0A0V0Q914_PSEPJ|nr:Protein kinase-like domain [Pseudocohnilembus persalinus]|eukprot:KRW98678.1 Protein kinase-like domain [Pseudocohnilembus persalinus]
MGNQIITHEYKISGLVCVDVLKLFSDNSLNHIRNNEQIKILIKETFKLLLKKNLEIDEETEPVLSITITREPSDSILDTPYLYQFDIDLKIIIQSAFFNVRSPQLFCQNAQENVQKYQINDFFRNYGEVKIMVNFWESRELPNAKPDQFLNKEECIKKETLENQLQENEELMSQVNLNSKSKYRSSILHKSEQLSQEENSNVNKQEEQLTQIENNIKNQNTKFNRKNSHSKSSINLSFPKIDQKKEQNINEILAPIQQEAQRKEEEQSEFSISQSVKSINAKPCQFKMRQSQTSEKISQYLNVNSGSQGNLQESQFQSTQNTNQNNILPNPPTLEITEEYFNLYYKKLTNIQEGGFGEVALYYDSNLHKLMAVKSLKNAHTHTEEALAKERSRVLRAIRGVNLPYHQRFLDEKIRGLRRNIVREIKLTYVTDDTPFYHRINRLEGVVYFESSQTFKLVFEFFGNLLFQDNRLHCDLLDFIYQYKENKQMFKQMSAQQKIKIIRQCFTQLLKAVAFLHNKKDMVIRDLKDTNILMKRIFNKDVNNESIYQTQIIDFGMSKDEIEQEEELDIADELSDFQVQRVSSISIQASHQGRHPKFLFNQRLLYEKKDDIFALGSLLYRLYQLFGMVWIIQSS